MTQKELLKIIREAVETGRRSLNLTNQQLTELPKEIGQLTELTYLSLENNQLTELPKEIGQLTKLNILLLLENKIHSLPKEIGQLSALGILDLDSNRLTELPKEIGQLTRLRQLWLSDNQLTILTEEIGRLTQLNTLVLTGNPNLISPPQEIVAQGANAILQYLRQLDAARADQDITEQPVRRYEAKLVLVGWGEVGKSCLVANLRGEDPSSIKGATQGVEVRPLPPFDHPDQEKHPGAVVKLIAWDFGGQEIDHATHRFFLTKRSLYLVLWKPREATEKEHVYDWLRSIALYCPGARVLLVATHADAEPKNPCRLDFEAIRREFGATDTEPARLLICDRLHHIDNMTRKGVPELWAAILREALLVSGLEDEWLPGWIAAEERLTGDARHEISDPEFLAVCAEAGVQEETVRGFLAGWWYDLGKILYFPDDPLLCQRVVLKPNWITKAISRVMRNEKIEENYGILDSRDLGDIWNVKDKHGYGPFGEEYYEPFLRLMHRFGLSYELPRSKSHSPRRFLVPYLLPPTPPAGALNPPEVTTDRPQLIYRFGLLPPGLMSRLIVALHRDVYRDMHWRTGVVLEDGGNFVRVETTSEVGQTVLRMTGWGQYHPYGFFTRVRDTLTSLLADYAGIEVRIDVPCPTSDCRNTISFRRLDGRWRAILAGTLDESQEMEYCEVCECSHKISQILYGIHPSSDALVAAKVDALLGTIARLEAGQEEAARTLREIGRQMLRQYQALWQKESLKCPPLFQLLHSTRSGFHPKEQTGTTYRLYLCCQWPEGGHRCKPHYDIYEPDAWLRDFGGLARCNAAILKLLQGQFPPVKDFGDSFIDGLAQLDTLLGGADGVVKSLAVWVDRLVDRFGEHIKMEETAIRSFYGVLPKQPDPKFRNLTDYPSPDDGVIWLCPVHLAEAKKRWGEPCDAESI